MSRSDNALLFETIQIRDGLPRRLEMHEVRMNASRRRLLGCTDTIDLVGIIIPPQEMRFGIVKCRVAYGQEIAQIEYEGYVPRRHQGLALATLDTFDYTHKYAERKELAKIDHQAQGRLPIIAQNGEVTDSTYANLALFDGEQWITPSTYLLNGIMRQCLLRDSVLSELPVRVEDLQRYQQVRLINAMLEFEESPSYAIESIVYI